MSKNEVIYEISGQFLTYFQNWFLLSNLEFECLHAQIRCTRIFIKILFRDKKWQWLQYFNSHQCQHIFAVARWNHPYALHQFKYHSWSVNLSVYCKHLDKAYYLVSIQGSSNIKNFISFWRGGAKNYGLFLIFYMAPLK